MVKQIRALLWIIAVAASMPAVSAQPGPNPAEIPTGDVWPSHADDAYAPPRSIPPSTGDDVDPSSRTIPRSPHEFKHEHRSGPTSQIKLDITLKVLPARAAAARHRAHRAWR